MSPRFRLGAVLLMLLMVAACTRPISIDETHAVVTLGEPDRLYPTRGPLSLTATVYNPGPATLDTGTGIVDGSRIELRGPDGVRLVAASRQPVTASPTTLPAGERVRLTLEMRDLFPDLRTPGEYTMSVVFPQFRSNTVTLNILPAFRADADYRAEVQTDRGTIVLRFFPEIAPRHVENFINLARSGFYDSILFHRVLRGVMIQAGDPTRSGRGGPGYTLREEFSDRHHVRGILSMAREGNDPNSAGSQWFICLDRIPDWDGHYTIFGEVESGMDVALEIGRIRVEKDIPQEAVMIERITISEASEH